MNRTTISLPDELAVLLAREAQRLGVSVSELVRTALQSHLGVTGDDPRPLPFAGIGHSGQRHTARDAEKILKREWTRARRR